MNGCLASARSWQIRRVAKSWGIFVLVAVVLAAGGTTTATAQRPSTARHVPELARYLDRVEISRPVVFRSLAVYPILLTAGADLDGDWLTMDDALEHGHLSITEKGSGGSVPVVTVENRSRRDHIFIMTGEVLTGGKQTRTVREDTVLAPGQRIELDVFCVEEHRWSGADKFAAGRLLLPQSIQRELRRGADQQQVWAEVARNNRAVGGENKTGSLALAIDSDPVRRKLAEVTREIVPKMPAGTMGFIFVHRGHALGAELFGSDYLARELLPKLLDSYAVDCLVIGRGESGSKGPMADDTAIAFFKRVCSTGSRRTDTPGSGAGIRTRSGGLLGDGVSLAGTTVHYGVQVSDRIVPKPPPRPVPYEERRR